MDENRLKILLNQYFNNTISRTDCEELLKYLDEKEDPHVSQLIDEYFGDGTPSMPFEGNQKEHIYSRVMDDIQKYQDTALPQPNKRISIISRTWYRAAAVLLITFSIGFLIYKNVDTSSKEEQRLAAVTNDIILPNSNSAILTLSDGQTIIISDSSQNIISEYAGIQIGRTTDGSVYYEVRPKELIDEQIAYNSFSTPKGNTFQLLLPDGTKVWLNSETTLRFPLAFTERKRVVELTGEAYFEVAHDSSKPFEVKANGSLIQVLGTHFNVSAYQGDDQMATTLLEGAVNVSKNGNSLVLKPGQQALVSSKTGEISKSAVNVESIMAWREGYFRFENESIGNIINTISRWYDIEGVEYQGDFNDRFTGTFQRSKKLSQLFTHFEKISQMRFKIEERRVVIME